MADAMSQQNGPPKLCWKSWITLVLPVTLATV